MSLTVLAFPVIAFPLILGVLLWLLPWLEEKTIAPEERASRIKTFLEQDDPEAIERDVAELLATSKLVRSARRIA